MAKFRNRTLNTLCVVPRTLGTWLSTIWDATKTTLYEVLDPIDGMGQTAWKIKDAMHKSFTEWKWYKKLWKAPLSLIASPFMLIEWAGETLRHTGCNICKHTRDTIANPFINFWHSLKWIWSTQPVSSFTFDSIDNKSNVSPKNRLATKFA